MYKSTGHVLAEIDEERFRQITDEGWTPEHDDSHADGALALAAAAYAQHAGSSDSTREFRERHSSAPVHWPWDRAWFKPTDRRRDLIKAAALIVAEIERLDRMKGTSHD